MTVENRTALYLQHSSFTTNNIK